ncbi:hypothetical protein [Streptomyces sp. NPDC000410]|uniref:hypothetical protein n=1 Tax=Streptomyces sp. NPDC000410 TaxID=3154254 RepID=UPI00331E57CD
MTTAHGWAGAVRTRLGLGRLLPLGDTAAGVWLAERAADTVLRAAAARAVNGVELGRLRIALIAPDTARAPATPTPPPVAVPPGPLRIEADLAVAAEEPLQVLAQRLRTALFVACEDTLGLAVTEIDLRVTALLDTAPEPPPATSGGRPTPPQGPVGEAAAAVPGVAHLTGTLGAPVHMEESHTRIELATAPGHRPLEVARSVREAVTPLLPSATPVTVVITDVATGP